MNKMTDNKKQRMINPILQSTAKDAVEKSRNLLALQIDPSQVEDIVTKNPILPHIRTDGDVLDDDPQIQIGKRKAALPPPIIINPWEK